MVALLVAAEVLIVPLVAVLFQANLLAQLPLLAPLLLLGTIGFAGVGTLFAAMLVRARTRDVLLPILLYPITVPVMIAGVRGTSALLQDAGRARPGNHVDRHPGLFRCCVRDARAVDVRAAHDRVKPCEKPSSRCSSSPRRMFAVRADLHRERAVRVDDAPDSEGHVFPCAIRHGDADLGGHLPAWPARCSSSGRAVPRITWRWRRPN